jgi:uncharacterized membrane protein (UPF0127 family)
MSNRLVKAGVVFCVLLGLAGCKAKGETIQVSVSGQDLTVEVARTAADREHGLMGRTDLGPRSGMIFLFDRDQHLTFWMKDTPTALSIAFISVEGRIQEIADMEPYSEKIVMSRLSARYALEMRKGAFAALGIHEGDLIMFPAGFPGTARIEP